MDLPFTRDQFFELFAAYHHALWFFALALWAYALVVVTALARSPGDRGRAVSAMLAIQWAWVALAYHAAFFSRINPAAWLFALLFLVQSGLFVWVGVVRGGLRFSRQASAWNAVAWVVIVYSLAYPAIVQAEGHAYPAAPTFGVPCPLTLLTIGLLLLSHPPASGAAAVIPLAWAAVAGSAALVLDVHADLALWFAGAALVVRGISAVRWTTSRSPGRTAGRKTYRT